MNLRLLKHPLSQYFSGNIVVSYPSCELMAAVASRAIQLPFVTTTTGSDGLSRSSGQLTIVRMRLACAASVGLDRLPVFFFLDLGILVVDVLPK